MFKCPKCKIDDNLTIHTLVRASVEVTNNEQVLDYKVGDLEWDNATEAECNECGWAGTVKKMTVREK